MVLVDADAGGDRGHGVRAVAREQRDCGNAFALERAHHVGGGGAHLVGGGNHAPATAVSHQHRGLGVAAHALDGRARGGRHGDGELGEQLGGPDLDGATRDLGDQPLAEMRGQPIGGLERNAA